MRLLAFAFIGALVCWSMSRPQLTTRLPSSTPLIKGYNIAWWDVNYGHQWNNGSFSRKKVRELLDLAQQGDAKLVRVWLFENHEQWQFARDKDGLITGLVPEFIPNVVFFLQECEKRGLKANLTLFDGNSFTVERLPEGEQRAWWWNILNNRFGMGEWFHQEVVAKLLAAIEDHGLTDNLAQIEFMNEIDAGVRYGIFADKWKSARSAVCQWHEWLKPLGLSYGVSVGHAGAQRHIVNNDVPAECTDYLDLHVYNDDGEIPSCDWFRQKAREGRRFQLGEFGQKSAAFNDQLQHSLTRRFLESAVECGFESALAWRLEDMRPGHNREAHYSYTAYGEARPAWSVLKAFPGIAP